MHNQIGPVIVDLIEELEIQLDQEFYAYYKVESPKLRQALPASAPAKPLKTGVLIDKQEATVKSAPVTGTIAHPKTKSPAVIQVKKPDSNRETFTFSFFVFRRTIRTKVGAIRRTRRERRGNRGLSLERRETKEPPHRPGNLWSPRS